MAKLGTVFLLFWAEDNRLVLYAVALMTVGILLNIIMPFIASVIS